MNADTVNHWDLPVTDYKPKGTVARVLEPVATSDDQDVVAVLRKRKVIVFDFYRHRPDRAEAVRRFA